MERASLLLQRLHSLCFRNLLCAGWELPPHLFIPLQSSFLHFDSLKPLKSVPTPCLRSWGWCRWWRPGCRWLAVELQQSSYHGCPLETLGTLKHPTNKYRTKKTLSVLNLGLLNLNLCQWVLVLVFFCQIFLVILMSSLGWKLRIQGPQVSIWWGSQFAVILVPWLAIGLRRGRTRNWHSL